MRAVRSTPGDGPGGVGLAVGMARKLLHAPAAALIKRGDPAEAALGVLACGAGLAGYAVGARDPR